MISNQMNEINRVDFVVNPHKRYQIEMMHYNK